MVDHWSYKKDHHFHCLPVLMWMSLSTLNSPCFYSSHTGGWSGGATTACLRGFEVLLSSCLSPNLLSHLLPCSTPVLPWLELEKNKSYCLNLVRRALSSLRIAHRSLSQPVVSEHKIHWWHNIVGETTSDLTYTGTELVLCLPSQQSVTSLTRRRRLLEMPFWST